MNEKLRHIIEHIGREHAGHLSKEAHHYLEVDLGRQAESMGYDDLGRAYRNTCVVVPLKGPVAGMKVMIDGRGFTGYAQFETGLAVPEAVARESGLTYRRFAPGESMILNVC
ncbi:hypothetical protein JCM14469_12430 [Desulfatiferula olefinivorans]